jgi:hypothetical protein
MRPRGDLIDEQFAAWQLKQLETKYPDPFQSIYDLTRERGCSLGYS